MKLKKLTILLVLLAGCSNQTNINQTGDEVIITNGAAFHHTWSHSDTYTLISNSVPQ